MSADTATASTADLEAWATQLAESFVRRSLGPPRAVIQPIAEAIRIAELWADTHGVRNPPMQRLVGALSFEIERSSTGALSDDEIDRICTKQIELAQLTEANSVAKRRAR